MRDFEAGLAKALRRAEIEYRAAHGAPGENTVDWLDGSSPQALAADLRRLGFRVAEVVDDVDTAGLPERWVITTGGLYAFCWPTPEARYVLLGKTKV